LGGIGTGLGTGVYNLASGLFGGGRRRKRRGGAQVEIPLAVPETVSSTSTPAPSTFQRIRNIAKDSKIISKALNEFGNPYGLGTAASTLGYGRRKRRGGAYVKFY
jgi:hypothetical protein